MNPCPCGYAGSPRDNCRCSHQQIQRYLNKLSGPLLDRIDMQVEVPSLPHEVLSSRSIDNQQQSTTVKERVIAARARQQARQGKCNRELTVSEIQKYCILDANSERLMKQVVDKFNLSARVYHRIIKVARTIADIEELDSISSTHLSEALTYRCLDRSKASL